MQYTLKKQHLLIVLLLGLLLGAVFYFFPAATGLKLKYLAAAAAALLVLYNTTWGLYLLALSLPFLPNLSLLLLAGLLLFSFLFHRLQQHNLELSPLTWEPALVVFMLAVIIFTFTSVTIAGSMRDFSIYLLSAALFVVLINQLENKNQLYIFLLSALLAAFVVSLYGIYQFVIGVPVESAWVDAARHPTLHTRVYSFFGNPNVLAEYLIMLIPFGLALTWSVRDYRKKALLLGVTGALTLALLLTFSRGGWMGFAVGLFLFALLRNKKFFFFLLLLLLFLVLAGAVIMPDMVLQRVATIGSARDTSNLYRFLVWREARLIIKDFWATGVGFGHLAFRKIYPFYMLSRTKFPYHVHNTYLQFLVETGAAGFLVFLWFIISIFKKGLRSLFVCKDQFSKNIIIAALSATAALLIQGLAEHVLYMPKIIMLFWLNIAIIFGVKGGPPRNAVRDCKEDAGSVPAGSKRGLEYVNKINFSKGQFLDFRSKITAAAEHSKILQFLGMFAVVLESGWESSFLRKMIGEKRRENSFLESGSLFLALLQGLAAKTKYLLAGLYALLELSFSCSITARIYNGLLAPWKASFLKAALALLLSFTAGNFFLRLVPGSFYSSIFFLPAAVFLLLLFFFYFHAAELSIAWRKSLLNGFLKWFFILGMEKKG